MEASNLNVVISSAVYVGNVQRDRERTQNWFIGHFISPTEIRHSDDVEVKWSVHHDCYEQSRYKYNKVATTVCVLIEGESIFKFLEGEHERVVRLTCGDYVIWRPFVPHKLQVESSAQMFVVRWPSIPNDQVELDR